MDIFLFLTFAVALISSILSGIAGVGGGFIMAPYWLLIGMSPAQGAANGSFMALGMGASSLAAFKGSGHFPRNKKVLITLGTITIISSLLGAFILPSISAQTFKPVLAVITIISLPLLFINKNKLKHTRHTKAAGYALFTLFMLGGSIIFSSAFSILIAIVLSTLFSLTVLQSTALRRLLGILQVMVLFSILALSGNFVWTHALAGIAGGIIGSYWGTKIAIKKGEAFAKYALFIGALISACALFI